MSVSKQKELNLLITAPQVPELTTGDDSFKNKVTVEEPSIQDNHVCEIKPQPQPQPEHRCSSKNNLGQSAAPQVRIKWGPQVSCIYLFSLSSSVDLTKKSVQPFWASQRLPRQPILTEVFVVFPTTPRKFDSVTTASVLIFFFLQINQYHLTLHNLESDSVLKQATGKQIGRRLHLFYLFDTYSRTLITSSHYTASPGILS